jgi:hypothetical protein
VRFRAALLAGLLALLASGQAGAHSFGQIYNLPVPFWMYAYGAAAALALSFVVVAWSVTAAATHRPSREIDLSEAAWVRTLRRIRLIQGLKTASVFALLLCIAAGLFGTPNPYGNFSMTFFWIVFMLGFAYLTTLLGDLYATINPWRVLADGLERVWKGFSKGRFNYPARLAWWPALAFYMAFIWIELFAHTRPFSLAVILLVYTGVNLLGVWLVSQRDWFRYCEFLSVFFRLIAKMAPLEYAAGRRDRLLLRAPFLGTLKDPAEHLSLLVFVLFMLSSTAFDGLRQTVPWVNLFWGDLYQALKPYVGSHPAQAYPILRPIYLAYQTVSLLLSPFLYLAIYLIFVWLAKVFARSARPLRELALQFGFSLLPIALVYNITHYYTLIQTQGVRILSLVSDPFGIGWNLFGTARWLRAPIIPDASTVWHTQVALIVLGHIASVYLAHVQALRIFPTQRQATLSQLPMLALMMVFTTAGLWILSQPIKTGT